MSYNNNRNGSGGSGSSQQPFVDANAYSDNMRPAFSPPKNNAKKRRLIIIAVGLLIIAIIVAAVVGGVLGSKNKDDVDGQSSSQNGNDDDKNDSNSSKNAGNSRIGGKTTTSSTPTSTPVATDPASIAAAAIEAGRFVTDYDKFFLPIYPTSAQIAAYSKPTILSSGTISKCSGNSDFQPGNEQDGTIKVRQDHPRLFATQSDWDCLPERISNDKYLAHWNETIFNNATISFNQEPKKFIVDGIISGPTKGLGDSGILDIAREIGLRIKHWGYVYRLTKDKKWADRAYLEMRTASGNNPDIPFGPEGDNWNSIHFLDTAEMTLAFAYGYDWFYDAWDQSQKDLIRNAILNLGISKGLAAYRGDPSAALFTWWTHATGNWNCVPAGGMAAGALAIYNEDSTNTAKQILPLLIENAKGNCLRIAPDGVTPESPDYWYFQSTGAVTLQSSLLSATGDVQGTLGDNAGTPSNIWSLAADFHMYVWGMTSKFNYGDHGPNKFVATANALLFWGKYNKQPRQTLFQRDQFDAPEPLSVFFYDENIAGAFWNGLPLDRYFPEPNSTFASMRSSWTDNNGVYAAMKASFSSFHNNHQDLDIGDFVVDALGERWAGELGSGNYLADGYFVSEDQDSPRWNYYRKRTEGQNAMNALNQNQIVNVAPFVRYESTNDVQGPSTSVNLNDSTAVYFRSDNTGAYANTAAAKRGIRLVNKRTQVLLQDEVNSNQAMQWRMHTNASVTLSNNDKTATLKINEKTLILNLDSQTGNAVFKTAQAVAAPTDPQLNTAITRDGFGNDVQQSINQPNPGVTVLFIDIPANTAETIYASFEPQWGDGQPSSKTPSKVALDNWSLTSHS